MYREVSAPITTGRSERGEVKPSTLVAMQAASASVGIIMVEIEIERKVFYHCFVRHIIASTAGGGGEGARPD